MTAKLIPWPAIHTVHNITVDLIEHLCRQCTPIGCEFAKLSKAMFTTLNKFNCNDVEDQLNMHTAAVSIAGTNVTSVFILFISVAELAAVLGCRSMTYT